jgi:hypothetical protein
MTSQEACLLSPDTLPRLFFRENLGEPEVKVAEQPLDHAQVQCIKTHCRRAETGPEQFFQQRRVTGNPSVFDRISPGACVFLARCQPEDLS